MNVTALHRMRLLDISTNVNNALAAIQVCQTSGTRRRVVTSTRSAVITGRTGRWRLLCSTRSHRPTCTTSSFAYCGSGGSGGRSDLSNADSWHPGGVNVTMGDGSVKFIKDSINIKTWMSLGTKSNGEVISSDSY